MVCDKLKIFDCAEGLSLDGNKLCINELADNYCGVNLLFLHDILVRLHTGTLELILNAKRVKIQEGDLLYISKSTLWSFCEGSSLMQGEIVCFDMDNSLIDNRFLHIKSTDLRGDFEVEQLAQYEKASGPIWNFKSKTAPSSLQLICDFIAGLENKNGFERNVERHLQRIGVGHREFSAMCREHFSLTPKELLLDIMVARAQQLAKGNKLKITEIAKYFGYPDASNFIKIFKARSGKTPAIFQTKK